MPTDPLVPIINIKKILLLIYKWITQICDPLRTFQGLFGFIWFLGDLHSYTQFPEAELIRITDLWPQLHDRTSTSTIDNHYFYVNGWAARRIVQNRPSHHVDIASQVTLTNLMGAVIPVSYIDFRPLIAHIEGLQSAGGDIIHLPFANCSIMSLSCLHVAEHIGLGRHGDPLNPFGTLIPARELCRVLAPGGNLYFTVPVEKPRLVFNSHRIHDTDTILSYFSKLQLLELSGVHDNGSFVENVGFHEFHNSEYACGMFCLRKHE